jgi:hypothetical protein
MSRRVIVAPFLLDHWRELPSSGGESAFFSVSTVGTTVAWYDFLLYSVVTGGKAGLPKETPLFSPTLAQFPWSGGPTPEATSATPRTMLRNAAS